MLFALGVHSHCAIENGGSVVDVTFNLLWLVLLWADLNPEGWNNECWTEELEAFGIVPVAVG